MLGIANSCTKGSAIDNVNWQLNQENIFSIYVTDINISNTQQIRKQETRRRRMLYKNVEMV